MGVYFRKLFALYPGEEKRAFYFCFLGFAWALAVMSSLKFSDTLFLTHLGAHNLPNAYIMTATGLLIIAFVQLYALQKIQGYQLYLTTIAIGITFYSCITFFLWKNTSYLPDTLWYSLRVFGYLFLAIMLTCYWTFVDQYHHMQDAKRQYCLYTSSIFAGIATSGAVLRSGLITFQVWLFAIILLLSFTFGLILYIRKTLKLTSDDHEEGADIEAPPTIVQTIKTLFSSKFTALLAASCFVTYLVLCFTEYNYMGSFETHFIKENPVEIEDSLANPAFKRFFGYLVLSISIINIIFGLFIYSRIIRRFGVTSLLVFTPILLFTAFFGWNVSDSLIFPIIGFFVDEGAVYIVEDSNLNLMLNGVPQKVKYRIRVLLESFFEPFGMLVSGLLLSIPGVNSKFIGLGLASILLLIATLLRRNYLPAMYRNLIHNAIHFERPLKEWFSPRLKEDKQFLSYLMDPSIEKQHFALKGILRLEDHAILDTTLHLLEQKDDATKALFLKQVTRSVFHKDPKVFNTIRRWLSKSDNLHFSRKARIFLAKGGFLSIEEARELITSTHFDDKAAGLIAFKKAFHTLPIESASHLRTLAETEVNQLFMSNKEDHLLLGLSVLSEDPTAVDIERLIHFVKDFSRPKIAYSAALALAKNGNIVPEKHIPLILSMLKRTHETTLKLALLDVFSKIASIEDIPSLIKISHYLRPKEKLFIEKILISRGQDLVPMLLSLTKDETLHDSCRLTAGRTLGRLSPKTLRTHLKELILKESARAKFYYLHSQTIQERNPDKDLKMLVSSLKSSYFTVLDFIIQLLGVAGELEDCELLSRLIRSHNPKVRSQVIETLEKSCDINIFRLIDPLICEIPFEEKMQQFHKERADLESFEELLEILSTSSLDLDQIIAATCKHRFNSLNWKNTLRKQLSNNAELFHHFAMELLDS